MACSGCASKLKGLSGTFVSVASHALQTGAFFSAPLGNQRMAICRSCEIFEDNPPMCSQRKGGCGCYLKVKTPLIASKCPKGKWTV